MHRTLAALTFLLLSIFLASSSQAKTEVDGGKTHVSYREFGAKGDGKSDDFEAIIKAHNFANKHGLKVIAGSGLTFYIGGANKTAVIKTNTDFRGARFIIDDRNVENRKSHIFRVDSNAATQELSITGSIQKSQTKVPFTLPQASLVEITNSHKKQYIRYGGNQNSGDPQTDILLVDPMGNIDKSTPLIWDFDTITKAQSFPIDLEPIVIAGGAFTTIANNAESKYTYYKRGISIRRSNVTVHGITHLLTGEGEQGAPYLGFISISNCANVTVKNSTFSGHKTYQTMGNAGQPVNMGSYDLYISKAINVTFENCTQNNDIHDRSRWGIMASNYCKNLIYQNCKLSRFDAHKGVYNAKISDSTLGHTGITVVGHGKLIIENTTVHGKSSLINFRADYGSTWDGTCIIRNCKLLPSTSRAVSVFAGSNIGQHDFGYPCSLPHTITIDRLFIDDSANTADSRGPALFSDFNSRLNTSDYQELYPYEKPHLVTLKNITTASGKKLRLSDNSRMFEGTQLKRKN